MSARYWILISGGLDESKLPAGLRFTELPPVPSMQSPDDVGTPATGSWRQVEDDDAGPELEGRYVELTLGSQEPPAKDAGGKTAEGGKPGAKHAPAKAVITGRRLLG